MLRFHEVADYFLPHRPRQCDCSLSGRDWGKSSMFASENQSAETPQKPAKKVSGLIFLDPRRCKGCGFCIAFCPPQVLIFSEEFNLHGYHFPRLANQDDCTGCNLCGLYCPDFAIYGVMKKKPGPRSSAGNGEGASE
jgi:2-oxoglutarate ferredoxin oxidoreductase subunit delta